MQGLFFATVSCRISISQERACIMKMYGILLVGFLSTASLCAMEGFQQELVKIQKRMNELRSELDIIKELDIDDQSKDQAYLKIQVELQRLQNEIVLFSSINNNQQQVSQQQEQFDMQGEVKKLQASSQSISKELEWVNDFDDNSKI